MNSLGTIEEALNRAGKPEEFAALCEEARALYAQAGLPLPYNQWYLQPTTPCEAFWQLLFRDEFKAPALRPEWQWQDPLSTAADARVNSYSLSDRPGCLTICSGGDVDLWAGVNGGNLNAPRMLLEAHGDFALETRMAGHWEKRLTGVSGLLVWKDVLNYVRLDKFARRHHGDIRLEARVAGKHKIFGRGQLPGDSYYLRLERTGERFAALCSTDATHWLSCGHVEFPAKDPLRVGVWAGHAMMVHFDYVQVLGRG